MKQYLSSPVIIGIFCFWGSLDMHAQQINEEIQIKEDAVRMIRFDFLPHKEEMSNQPLVIPIDKKWMQFEMDLSVPRSLTDTFKVRKPTGYIRLLPFSIWTGKYEDPVYDVTTEGRPQELRFNMELDFKKVQTDYGHTLKPSSGKTYEMINGETSVKLDLIVSKYIIPLFKRKNERQANFPDSLLIPLKRERDNH